MPGAANRQGSERSPLRAGPRGAATRLLLIAWAVVCALAALHGLSPYAAHASTMRLHGALLYGAPSYSDERPPAADGRLHGAIDGAGEAVGIISHRGAAAIAPENTIAAMRVALDRGVDFVETDVQLTADGVPVLFHDETVDRTTNGGGLLARWSYDELRTLDAGSWFSPDYAGERVPSLEEFLDLLEPTTSRALVELKGEWTAEQIAGVVDLLRERHLANRIALQSFEVDALESLADIAPEFARIMLTREWDETAAETAARLQVSAVGARAKLFDARPELIPEVQQLGIGTLVYTLNSERRWARAVDRGIDLVITDDPVALAEWRGGA